MEYILILMTGTENINKKDNSQFKRSVNKYTIIQRASICNFTYYIKIPTIKLGKRICQLEKVVLAGVNIYNIIYKYI